MSSSHADAAPSPPASPRNHLRIDISSHQRPKFVSFGRESELGGPPIISQHSPLIRPAGISSEADPLLKEPLSPLESGDDWRGEQDSEETKSSWFLFLLTLCGLGLQIGWSVETSNGSVSPFSISLQITANHYKSLQITASIWRVSRNTAESSLLTRLYSLICFPSGSASPSWLSSGLLDHSRASSYSPMSVSRATTAASAGERDVPSSLAVPQRLSCLSCSWRGPKKS